MYVLENLDKSHFLLSGINLVFCKNQTDIKNFLTSFYKTYESQYNKFQSFFCKGSGIETNLLFKKNLEFDKNIIITDIKKIESFTNKTTLNKIIKNHTCILVFIKNIKSKEDFDSIYNNFKNDNNIFKLFFSNSIIEFLNEDFKNILPFVPSNHYLVKINYDIEKKDKNIFVVYKISSELIEVKLFNNDENITKDDILNQEFYFNNPIEIFHESDEDFLFLQF